MYDVQNTNIYTWGWSTMNENLNVWKRNRKNSLKNPMKPMWHFHIKSASKIIFNLVSFHSLWITSDADRATNTHQHIVCHTQFCYFWWKHCKFNANSLGPHGEMERDNTMAMNCVWQRCTSLSAVWMHVFHIYQFDCVCEWVNEFWRALNV